MHEDITGVSRRELERKRLDRRVLDNEAEKLDTIFL